MEVGVEEVYRREFLSHKSEMFPIGFLPDEAVGMDWPVVVEVEEDIMVVPCAMIGIDGMVVRVEIQVVVVDRTMDPI